MTTTAQPMDVTPPAAMAQRMAGWIHDFAATPVAARASERGRAILLDSLACALCASADEKARPALRLVARLGGNGDCTIIGTRLRAPLPSAGFANGALIRLLDFNDTYAGPRQIGHPSDTIGIALAAAEAADRSGADLLQAIRIGYEIYGRLLDLCDQESPWDHVTMSGLAAAAITGWLLRLPAERLGHALALAATHCATLGEVRVGKISAAKSFASAIVVQTAALLTLLAADGMTGPERALDGRRGFGKLILDGVDLEGFFTAAGDDRLLSAGLKPYPCLVLGQGPVDAALELRCRVPKPERIERLTLALADTGPARLRLLDPHGRAPESSEAADHSLYFLVAVAVLDGRFGLDQIRGGRWRDRDVRALMDRIEATIDPGLAPKTALPCRIEAALADGGRCIVARPLTPGSVANPLSWEEVVEKFRRCAEGVLGAAAQDRVIGYIADIERLPSARLLAEGLAADAP